MKFFTTTMFQTAEINKRLGQLEALKGKKLAPPKTATAPEHAPLSASDFTPAGPRTVATQLAAAAPAKARAQVQVMADLMIPAIEGTPGFRKNNLAAAMLVALGSALQVAFDQPLSDESAEALMAALNDALVADSGFAKMTAEQRTQAYDTFLIVGGLMAGIFENAKETNDRTLMPTANDLALATLKLFGLPTKK